MNIKIETLRDSFCFFFKKKLVWPSWKFLNHLSQQVNRMFKILSKFQFFKVNSEVMFVSNRAPASTASTFWCSSLRLHIVFAFSFICLLNTEINKQLVYFFLNFSNNRRWQTLS